MRPAEAVRISENQYNDFLKAKRDAEYLSKLDRSFEQLKNGEVVGKSLDELERMGYCIWVDMNEANRIYHDTEWGAVIR